MNLWAIIKASFKHQVKLSDVKMLFGDQTRYFGEHGRMRASHAQNNQIGQSIPFTFVGMSTPPKLTPEVLADIWKVAEQQGYVPHYIESYGKTIAGMNGTTVPHSGPELTTQDFDTFLRTSQK